MSETERLRLLDKFKFDEVTERVELRLHFVELTLTEEAFEFGIGSEIGLKQSSCVSNDNDDGFDATGGGFLNRILDQRLARDRKHLLGQSFGGGKHTGAVTGGGDYGFCDFLRMEVEHRFKICRG